MLTNGNLGIGSTAPGQYLDIKGGGARIGKTLQVNDASTRDNSGNLVAGIKMGTNYKSGLFVTENFLYDSSSGGAFISSVIGDQSSYPNSNAIYASIGLPTTSVTNNSQNGWGIVSRVETAAGFVNRGGFFSRIGTVDQANTGSAYAYQAFNYLQDNGTLAQSLANYTGFFSYGQHATATTSLTNHYDFYAAPYNLLSNGVITNRYGLYLNYSTTGITNAYGVYQVDSGVKNYFGGNVGIGTFLPVQKLTINGGVGIGTALSSFVTTRAPDGGMIVEGNVGINSTAPGQKLDVVGTVRATAFSGDGSALTNLPSSGGFTDDGTIVHLTTSTDNVGIGTTDASNGKLIVMGGNVGIGTFAPSQAFDVNGNISVSGTGDTYFLSNVGIGSTVPTRALDVTARCDRPLLKQLFYFVDESYGGLCFSLWSNGYRHLDGGIFLGHSIYSSGNSAQLQYNNGGAFAGIANSNVTASGNVGLGTTLSTNKLGVSGSVGIGSAYAGYYAASSNGLIVQGNVGVGTFTPQAMLDVAGNIRTSGQMAVGTFSLVDGATIAVDWNNGNIQYVTLGGNRAITFNNPVNGSTYAMFLTQDGTGSRTITSWPTITWSGGSTPTLTTTASKTDIVSCKYLNGVYYCDVSVNF